MSPSGPKLNELESDCRCWFRRASDGKGGRKKLDDDEGLGGGVAMSVGRRKSQSRR
jgi:hypothetical protein